MALNTRDIEQKVEALIKSVSSKVDDISKRAVEIPKFSEIKSKEVLYESYGKVVQEYDELTRLAVRVSSLRVNLNEFKALVDADLALTPSMKVMYAKPLLKGRERLLEYYDILMLYKNNLDKALYFYNSAQYILGSSRFEEFN